MNIKDLRGEDGSFSEDKVNDLINQFTDIKGKNEDLSTKVSQFDEKKNTIINDTRNSLLNIGEGAQLNIQNLKDGDPLDDSFVALATEAGISQDVFDKMAPAFTKLKENMQSVYKTEEHLSRVKQSKELGIDLNEKTIAGLSDDEYSKIVNLAQKSTGSSNTGNAGNNDITPPMDIETAQKRFDQLDKKQLPSLENVAEKHKLRKIINQEDIIND
jgi:hypothetical protein